MSAREPERPKPDEMVRYPDHSTAFAWVFGLLMLAIIVGVPLALAR